MSSSRDDIRWGYRGFAVILFLWAFIVTAVNFLNGTPFDNAVIVLFIAAALCEIRASQLEDKP